MQQVAEMPVPVEAGPVALADNQSRALDRAFVWQYVQARESYVPAMNAGWLNFVRLTSTASVYLPHMRMLDPMNPDSPARHLQQTGLRTAHNAEFETPEALPDFQGAVQRLRFFLCTDGTGYRIRYGCFPYRAQVTFEYVPLQLSRQEQLLNPLGFRVKAYEVKEEPGAVPITFPPLEPAQPTPLESR